MKFLLPKILLVFAIICIYTLDSYSCTNPNLTGAKTVCIGKSSGYLGSASRESGCGNDTKQEIKVMEKPEGSNPIVTPNNEEENDVDISFDKAGLYIIEYTFFDETACGTTACSDTVWTRVVEPAASFAVDSVLVCKNNKIIVDINYFDASDATVTGDGINRSIKAGSNGIGTFISNLDATESTTIYITKAEDRDINCPISQVFDSLKVIVLDEPNVENPKTICNAAEEYSMEFDLIGGDGTYELLTPEIGTIVGNKFISNFRPSGETFTFSINSGPTCGIKEFTKQDICDCVNNAGVMENNSLFACASDDITVFHDKSDLVKRPFDSIIYILHNSDQNDIGVDFALSYSPVFSLPRPELADSQLYVSAVVGPFTIEDFDDDNLDIFCSDVSFGAKVKWFSKDNFSISGKLEVCANEMNRMYAVILEEPLKEPSKQFWDTSEGSGAVLGSQNEERVFLSFPSATSNSTLYYHSDFTPTNSGDLVCRTTDSIDISVDGLVSAPEESNIILWPGDILASTSDGPCYQWGSVNKFEPNFAISLIPGANEKYLFSEEKITQSTIQDKGFFVAIYDTPNCDFSLNNCNSIIFFNEYLNPTLTEGNRDDFSLAISPNPNDGTFRLEIKGSFRGTYRIDVISDIGKKVANYKVDKLYDRSIRDIELSHLPDGMYVIVITNEFGKREIIKTIITK